MYWHLLLHVHLGGRYVIEQENTIFTDSEFESLSDEEILKLIDVSQLKGMYMYRICTVLA